MLSPVSPVSSADLSFSTSAPRPDNPSAVAPVPATQADPAEVPPFTSDANIRAVSGELRLTQNVSVLAETLGKLLNIARMDGESAETYVNRLVAGLQTIPIDQKAMLEKALGSILRGISLDMLATILKSSSGPEAARLSVMFELSRSSAGATMPKPTITPYLQDLVPESRVIISPIKNTGAPLPASADVPDPAAETVEKLVTAMKNDSTTGKQTASPFMVPEDRSTPISAPINNSESKPASPHLNSGSQQTKTTPEGQTAIIVHSQAVTDQPELANQTSRLPQTQSQAATTLSHQINVAPHEGASIAGVAQSLTPQVDEREALAPVTSVFSGATANEMEKLLLSVVAGSLPAQGEVLPALDLQLSGGGTETDHAPKLPIPAHASIPLTTSAAEDAENALTDLRGEAAVMQKATMAHDIKAALLDQPMLHGAVAAMVAKDGIPLPFVNYPAAGDEPESEAPPRGRWPSSEEESSENDENQEPSRQGTDQEERDASNDEPIIDHSVSEGANDDASTGSAESYYLRMSSMS